MKLYVIKFNSIAKSIVLIFIAIGVLSVSYYSREKVAVVFQTKREIPIYSVECPDKKASITFDCAWGSDDIPDILNTLRNHQVKATFFIVGAWAKKYPEAVKMISDEGHDVANHSYSHLKMGNIDANKIKDEILKCNAVLEEITGKKNDLFRVPYGDYNNDVVRVARELNNYTIQWDVDSLDWKPEITPEQIKSRIFKNVKNGSIMLFHNDTQHTSKILPDIISSLKSEGYIIVPVSELILRENYYIDSNGTQIIKK